MDRSQYRGALYTNPREKKLSRNTKQKRTVPRVLLYAVLLTVILVVMGIAAKTPKLYIQDILVMGGRDEVKSLVKARAEEYISEKKAFFFTNQNQVVFSGSALESRLIGSLGVLKSVEVSRTGLQSISIEITEREAILQTEVGGLVAHIDAEGIVFIAAAQNESERALPKLLVTNESLAVKQSPGIKDHASISLQPSITLSPGLPFLPSDQYENLHLIIDELAVRNMRVREVVLFAERHAEFYIENSTEGRFLFDVTGDVTKQLATYDSAKKTEELRDALQSNRIGLKYIDLRTPGKVFYKF